VGGRGEGGGSPLWHVSPEQVVLNDIQKGLHRHRGQHRQFTQCRAKYDVREGQDMPETAGTLTRALRLLKKGSAPVTPLHLAWLLKTRMTGKRVVRYLELCKERAPCGCPPPPPPPCPPLPPMPHSSRMSRRASSFGACSSAWSSGDPIPIPTPAPAPAPFPHPSLCPCPCPCPCPW